MKFKFVSPILVSLGLTFLASFLLFSAIFQTHPVKYFFVSLTIIICAFLFYKKGFIEEDRIVIVYPLMGIRKEFRFDEIRKVVIVARFSVRVIQFNFTKAAFVFKYVSFSGSYPFDNISTFLKSKNVEVKYDS
jgi:hypothetical protein